MQVMEAIKGRRSVRSFLSDPVTDEQLNFILEAARWAPSWANTQAREFIVVKDQATKEALSRTLSPNNPSTDAMVQAPIVIAALGRKGLAGFKKGALSTKLGDWFMFDVALALQNLTLAAHSQGLGTVHVGAMRQEEAEEILQVPEGYSLIELIPLGRPAVMPGPTPRKELSEIVHLDRYGQKWGA